jgi:hypothetical protein
LFIIVSAESPRSAAITIDSELSRQEILAPPLAPQVVEVLLDLSTKAAVPEILRDCKERIGVGEVSPDRLFHSDQVPEFDIPLLVALVDPCDDRSKP